MRLATIIPENGNSPLAVVDAGGGRWLPLQLLARHLRLPSENAERLEDFLEDLSHHANEVTAAIKAADILGSPVRATNILAPILVPPAFRDFYAFEAHVKTARARRGLEMPQAWYELPVFYFSNHLSIVGQDAPVFAPAGSVELDYELELGIVIGKGGRDINRETAWEHVAGFTIINDLSARDLQRQEMSVGLGPAKGKDFATAVGPVLVTLDEFTEVIDGERLSLPMLARVNGQELSRGNSGDLFHTIPQLIAHASRDADLFPGDLLGTGTVGTGCILELGPENCGGWLRPGSTVELEIENIGILRTRIIPHPT